MRICSCFFPADKADGIQGAFRSQLKRDSKSLQLTGMAPTIIEIFCSLPSVAARRKSSFASP